MDLLVDDKELALEMRTRPWICSSTTRSWPPAGRPGNPRPQIPNFGVAGKHARLVESSAWGCDLHLTAAAAWSTDEHRQPPGITREAEAPRVMRRTTQGAHCGTSHSRS